MAEICSVSSQADLKSGLFHFQTAIHMTGAKKVSEIYAYSFEERE